VRIREERLRPYAWSVLGLTLAATLAGAFFYARLDWTEPRLLAGEATYLAQARSLAYDFDLTYERADFDRLLLDRGAEPPDLELASGSGGRRIAFDRPFPYALWLAPFVRLAPESGFAIANALLLAAASLFAAWVLQPYLGLATPVWITVLLGASVAWSYVWLATGDLFLWALTVAAFGLLARLHVGGHWAEPEPPRAVKRAVLAAGALLAIPAATEPLYGVLAAAAFFVVPARRERGVYALGLAVGLASIVAVGWWAGSGIPLAATSFRFTPETGFPLVDFTAADWPDAVRRFQALHWDEAPRFAWGLDPLLWAWDALYLLAGRHIGLLPYYLPAVLLALAGSFAGWRRAIAIAAGAWMIGVVILHPFDLYGGEGALANRLFLPVYGAAFFLLDRRPWIGWAAALPLAAAVFLWKLWTAPGGDPISRDGGYRYVTAAAERYLPYETSQRRIPANELADHQGLRLLLRNEGVWSEARRERLVLDEKRRARMVIASPEEMPAFVLEFGADAPSDLRVRGAELAERVLLADGGIAFRLRPGSGARRHPLWWTPERQWLYLVDFELPADPGGSSSSLGFRLVPESRR
jgi:hypothetical protein